MNDFYQQFLCNSQNGIPSEVSLGTNNAQATIASVYLEGEFNFPPQPTTVTAYLRLDLPTGRLLIHFLRRSIELTCQSGHFDQNYFVGSDQLLSPGVVKALGWESGEYHLAKGNYPILEDADFYTVSARVGRPVSPAVKRRLPRSKPGAELSTPTLVH